LIHAYDLASGKVIVMSANAEFRPDVWTFDVANDRWEKHAARDDAPQMISVFEPGVGRSPLVYDSLHDVFFLIVRKEGEIRTWAYRAPR
jgi:hypothetical protein